MIATPRFLFPLLRVFGIFLMAATLSARAASIALSFNNAPSNGVVVTNGTLVPVNVVAATGGAPVIVSATLNFRTWAPLCTNLWNSISLATNASPTNFVATIPRLPASNVDYYASCIYLDEVGNTYTNVSVTNTYTVGTTLDTTRYQDFESGWSYTGSNPTFFPYQAATGWTGSLGRVFSTGILGGIAGINTLELYNPVGAYVQSPWITGGVAYVTFAADMRYNGDTGTLAVAYSTDGVTWTTNASYVSLNGPNILHPSLAVGVNAPCMIRVLTTAAGGTGGGYILVDNIAAVPPAAGLTLATNGVSPAPPQSMDSVTISCSATDLSTNEPTINRRVTVWYNAYDTNSVPAGWVGQAMTNTSTTPFQYFATLPPLNAGSNVYYFTCAFDGYYYTNTDKRASYTSATSAYVINFANIRILQLGTNAISFGGVATNAMSSTNLLVMNAGNVPLTVTNVGCAAPFACQSLLPLSVPAGNSTNLIITFAPSDTNVHTNLLIVYSDATAISGTNTVLLVGTGLVAETTTMLSLTGPTNGPKNTLLTYTAMASNNYNHALQYQFDWGDGVTSVWTNASVQSHAWTNATTYLVNARACSVSVTSSWYALPTVTLTNTRTIRLVGNYPGLLDCGGVATGSVVSLPLLVCNDGVDTLTVTNITAPAPFSSISPTSFPVPMNGTQPVYVTFAPLATNVFTNTLTVWCNALSGTNTIGLSGTGIVSEAISAPVLNCTTNNGQPLQTLSFWATATDNYGSNIWYRFDWGGGSISNWGSIVASGTTYTNTYSWATPTTVLVRAQAQNAVNTNVFSAWSLPLAVTIDYTRVLVLGGSNLLFGLAVTNTTATMSLAVTNSGSGPLSVANVTGTSGFSASPTNFTLSAGVGSNITVTFMPTLLQGYTGTITFVSNQTSGSNTVAVTGTGVTFNAVTGLTGPTSGIVSNTLTPYAVTVTNTWTEPVAYMFGWGDGVTSGWQAASSTSHVWTTAGTNAVRARVQSTVHTNVISAWSSPLLVTVFGAPSVTFGTVTNGMPISVTVTIGALPGTVSNVVFWYLPPNSTGTNMVSMTLTTNGSSVWLGTLPPLTAGTMTYKLQYVQAGTSLSYPSSGNYSFAITNDLGLVRQDGFEDTWTYTGTYPNYNIWNASGWTGASARVFNWSLISRSGTPPTMNDSSFCMEFMTNGAFVASPVMATGIGTIYFQAGVRYTGNGTVVVQVSTNGGMNWISLQTYTATAAGGVFNDIAPALTLNLRVPAMVMISLTNTTFGQYILLDNIIISPPPTDMTITESLHNPGYPNSKDPVLVRCQTTDYDPVNAPSVNRRLSVVYQYSGNSTWTTNNMSNVVVNGSSLYQGTIPAYSPVYNSLGDLAPAISYYFKCDFDGYYYSNSVITNATSPYPSENLSPSFNPDQRTPGSGSIQPLTQYQYPNHYPVPSTNAPVSVTNIVPSYTINPYRQDDSGFVLQATPNISAPQNVLNLVDDYTWRGQVQVSGITNLAWFFVRSNHYSNNATAFDATSSWGGGTNQDFIFPPLGGTAVLSTNDPLQASFVYNGFLVFQYNTSNHTFLVKRAVYQDFDHPLWASSPNYFQESWSLFAITTFTNDFSSWGTNYFQPSATWKTEDFQSDPVNGPLTSSELPTVNNWWQYQDAVNFSERAYTDPRYTPPYYNNAMQLNNQSGALGSIFNFPPNGFTEGIDNFTFRARLSQNDGRPALYTFGLSQLTNGSPWTSGYRITNTVSALSMSPAFPSVSLLFCYQPGSWPNYNYYELRLTQVSDSGPTDGKLQLDLYRWNNGVNTTEIAGFPKTYNTTAQKLTGTPPLLMDVSWTNVAGLGVVFTGSVSRAGGATLFGWSTNTVDSTAGYIQNGGTVGFLCSDAEAQISALGISAGTNLDAGMLSATNFPTANWYLGQTTLPACWTNVSGNLSRPLVLAQAPRLSLTLNRTGTAKSPTLLRTYWTNSDSWAVTSYGYTNFSHSFKIWDKAFLSLQYTNGILPVVVDDLAIDPWRAYTRGIADSDWTHQAEDSSGVLFWDWTGTSQQSDWSQNGNATPNGPIDPTGWLIFEGLIVNSGSSVGNYASFDQSRANPNLDQGLWSPVLSNGIGSLTFQASVGNGTSVYGVATAVITPGQPISWSTIQIFTNTVADGWVNRSVYVGHVKGQANETGRIRIVQLSGAYGTSPGAILNIDNLVALDNPPTDSTSWHAYNCLIVAASQNTNTISHAIVSQTCYLNNSPTNGVLAPLQYSADNPYIQSPQVDTGIGEISFDYCAWDANPAYVSIQVAPSAATPAGQWTVITNFTVTSTNRQHFDMVPFDTVDKVMRIYVTNAIPVTTTGRLCIDNILMTEPVRAGYQIMSVTLLPAQPLMTDQVGVQATIGNKLMNPLGIHVFLSYVVGSNAWGLNQWWGTGNSPTTGVTTIELTNTTGNTYATIGTPLINSEPVDSVVQYVVWGTNADQVGRPYFQGTNAFTNPSWYYPVDLNPKDGGGNYLAPANWSPYYYVYSCPPGSVWVNEINYPYYQPDYDIGSYIELIGPANAHLGNWTIDLLDSNPTLVDTCTIANTFMLTNTSNGWGFFVWGDATVPNVNQTFTGPPNSMPVPGAVRLVRSMGAWEDRVCWAMDLDGYTSAGFKNWFIFGAPLDLEGMGTNKSGFVWSQPSSGDYTPGLPNTDQVLGPAPVISLSLYYTLTSLVGANGTASFVGAVQIASGGSTTIVYTANSWYRIGSFTSNGGSVGAALNASVYTQQIVSMAANISNNATFYQPTNWVTSTISTDVPFAAGSADQLGLIPVLNGSNLVITYTAAQWSRISQVNSNGTLLGAQSSPYALTLGPVAANMTAAGAFTRDTWTITQPGSFVGGSANPAATSIPMLNGTTTQIVYTATQYYRINTITTNGSPVAGALNLQSDPVSFGPVVANIPVTASFYLPTNTITWTLGLTGLSPAGGPSNSVTNVVNGSTVSIVVTAAQWSVINNVNSNGTPVAGGPFTNSYTLNLGPVDGPMTGSATVYRAAWNIAQTIGANGAANPTNLLFQMPNGATTTIVYSATTAWFRVSQLLTNAVVIAAASNQLVYTQQLFQVQGNYTNNVFFDLLPDYLNGQNVPTSWLTNFGQSESAPFGGGLSVSNAYMLNMNPYLSNAVTLAMHAIAATSTVRVAVQLLESTNGSAYMPQQSIYGTLVVDATTNLVGASWTPVASTQMPPPSVIFDTNGVATFALPTDTNKFYRARIQ